MSDTICSSTGDSAAPLRAVVVGAAGGAGRLFVSALDKLEFEIVAVDHDEIGLARLRQDLGCATIAADVLDEGGIAGLFDAIEASVGIPDLLINVAGRGYVRTLSMMRVSRAFSERGPQRIAYVVNLARPSAADDGLVTYAGSDVAFDRLSHSLSDSIANPLVKVITLHGIDSAEAVSDACRRIRDGLRDVSQNRIDGTEDRAVG